MPRPTSNRLVRFSYLEPIDDLGTLAVLCQRGHNLIDPAVLLPNGIILLLYVGYFLLQILYLAHHLLVGYPSVDFVATFNADGTVFCECVTANVDQVRLKRRRIDHIHGSSSVL